LGGKETGAMNWDAIGAFGEIIGALAVVFSLIYVGRQFRISSTYALENIYFQTSNNFSSTEENARVVRLGNHSYPTLSPDEQQHYGLLIHNLFSAIDAIYIQSQRGLMTRESAERGLKVAHYYYSQPGFRTLWDQGMRDYFSDPFVVAIETGIVGDNEAPRTDFIANEDAI
jgi:hypothetical protein